MKKTNPFEFDGADKLSKAQVASFFSDDFNYQRFIWSRRNVFLCGERGTGKTMTLRYYSLPVQLEKAKQEEMEVDLSIVCIHISCNTPLTQKREHELFEEFPASILSEHFLVVSMMDAIVKSVKEIPDILEGEDTSSLQYELEYLLGIDFPTTDIDFFEKLCQVITKQSVKAQKVANLNQISEFYEDALSFSSGVVSLINCLRKLSKLKDTHFALMMDDVHDLNIHQIKALNSWVAYRDNTAFSFKVATAQVDNPVYSTKSGGAILPDHDFINVDMSSPFRDKTSAYGKLARRLVQIRLNNAEIESDPDTFFPTNPSFQGGIEKYDQIVREEAEKKYPDGPIKKINDHVYKYKRARYFSNLLSSRANRPAYSGFDLMVHMSTGVIRNLLMPCYFMFDRVASELSGTEIKNINEIPPNIQTEVILKLSQEKWRWLENNIANSISGCSKEQGNYIYQLFDNLAILFRKRLIENISEPRALTFSISETEFIHYEDLLELLRIAKKSQYLFSYKGPKKEDGKRTDYYNPLRILMPERKLDPVGQHACISLKASDLWAAATQNKQIPFNGDTPTEPKGYQQTLW